MLCWKTYICTETFPTEWKFFEVSSPYAVQCEMVMVVIASYTRLAIVSCTMSFKKLNNYINCLINIWFFLLQVLQSAKDQLKWSLLKWCLMECGLLQVLWFPAPLLFILLSANIYHIKDCEVYSFILFNSFKIKICVWFFRVTKSLFEY